MYSYACNLYVGVDIIYEYICMLTLYGVVGIVGNSLIIELMI